jgi:hypothetical protein
VRVRFEAADAKRRPRHWRAFGSRISPLTDPSPRKAVNPANAVLNYLYAILEAEARIAALAVGLDPGLGIIHSDRSNRDSLACDLMEPVRPAVDRFFLDYLERRTFTKEDVFELLNGQCRLMPTVTRELASSVALWAHRVRGVAEYVVATLGGDRRRTHLTSLRDSGNQFQQWARKPRGKGAVVRGFNESDTSQGRKSVSPMAAKLRAVLAANRDWERRNERADPTVFRQGVLPTLKAVPLRQIREATGLAMALCTKIRRGDVLPHPRHWEALARLADPIGQLKSASHNVEPPRLSATLPVRRS